MTFSPFLFRFQFCADARAVKWVAAKRKKKEKLFEFWLRDVYTFDLSYVKIVMRFDSADTETLHHPRGRLRERAGRPVLGIPRRKLRILPRTRRRLALLLLFIDALIHSSGSSQRNDLTKRMTRVRILTRLKLLLPPGCQHRLGRFDARQPSSSPFLIFGEGRRWRRRWSERRFGRRRLFWTSS